jgi:hypothetical protein
LTPLPGILTEFLRELRVSRFALAGETSPGATCQWTNEIKRYKKK